MREIYQKYQKYLPALFFVSGFLFDLIMVRRIDHAFSLIQQAVYLCLLMLFLYWEVCRPRFLYAGFFQKVWHFHLEASHFLFGALLSLYTIFYFKSASLATSLIFMALMAALLLMNEWPAFKKQGVRVRSALLSLCLFSYFVYLVPVVTGRLGWSSFLLAMVLSSSLFLLLVVYLQKTQDKSAIQKQVLWPGLIIQALFVLLYFTKVLPPVPISIKTMGIYHQIEKKDGVYELAYESGSWWDLWEPGTRVFLSQPGDRVYCFVSVFSPTQFSDQLQLEWWHWGPQGWSLHDSIPLPIRGGREQGYRGFAFKENYSSGRWQVRVVTSDQREVGRLSFQIEKRANLRDKENWKVESY